jgi:hypothetical protein
MNKYAASVLLSFCAATAGAATPWSIVADLDLREAIHAYDKAIALEPSHAQAHFHKGEALKSTVEFVFLSFSEFFCPVTAVLSLPSCSQAYWIYFCTMSSSVKISKISSACLPRHNTAGTVACKTRYSRLRL